MKLFSILLGAAFVGLVTYWVIQASMPLLAPEVSVITGAQILETEVFIPYPCIEMIRVFRSGNDGLSWDRITPPASYPKEGGCVFPDSFSSSSISDGASLVLYRYARVDARRNVSRWSETTPVPFFGN
ncbi:MAG: hypothetical protein Q8R20_02500 [Nanoarchaeota archaeon]|nr:hypothetical protein [Nanoarchaeota archaeon]